MSKRRASIIPLRKGRTHLVFASLLPRQVHLSVNATRASRWIRIGLLPGTGTLNGSKTVTSFCSVLLVKAEESRTLSVRA